MKNKKAFSLIELSIVILIISLVIGGVFQGKELIAKSRLASAQKLTRNSGIEKIDDLYAWFETTMPDSFGDISFDNNSLISTWKSRASSDVESHNAIQNNQLNQPQFSDKALNEALPALKFSGNQSMEISGTPFESDSYTIFVVERRDSDDNNLFFIGGARNGFTNFNMGYNNNSLRLWHSSSAISNPSTFDSLQKIVQIHCFLVKNNGLMEYYLGNSVNATTSQTDTTSIVFGSSNITIGASAGDNTGNYDGNLFEVILFQRSLLQIERQEIAAYLMQKYTEN